MCKQWLVDMRNGYEVTYAEKYKSISPQSVEDICIERAGFVQRVDNNAAYDDNVIKNLRDLVRFILATEYKYYRNLQELSKHYLPRRLFLMCNIHVVETGQTSHLLYKN